MKVRTRRGVSEAIGTILFLFIFIATLFAFVSVLSPENRQNTTLASSQRLLNAKTKESLGAYTVSPNNYVLVNQGSEESVVVDTVSVSGTTITVQQLCLPNTSPCTPYVVPLGYATPTIPFGCSGKCGFISSLGNVFWTVPYSWPERLYNLTVNAGSCGVTGPAPGTYANAYPGGATVDLTTQAAATWSGNVTITAALQNGVYVAPLTITGRMVETCSTG